MKTSEYQKTYEVREEDLRKLMQLAYRFATLAEPFLPSVRTDVNHLLLSYTVLSHKELTTEQNARDGYDNIKSAISARAGQYMIRVRSADRAASDTKAPKTYGIMSPSWSQIWTEQQAVYDLSTPARPFAFKGEGWYVSSSDTLLVTRTGRWLENESGPMFYFQAYGVPGVRDALARVLDLPVHEG
jgi:hypothetical protein